MDFLHRHFFCRLLQPNPSFPLDLHPYNYDRIDIMKKIINVPKFVEDYY